MWSIVRILAFIIILAFGHVLLFGAPYLPTLKKQMEMALDLLDLKPGQTVLELGCGDGRVLIAAAKRGLNAIGYELNPLLALIAWLRAWRWRGQVRVVWGNYWTANWQPANGIFVFLLGKYMKKLDKKIVQYNHKPVKLVSFAFKIPGKPIAKKQQGLYLYRYD